MQILRALIISISLLVGSQAIAESKISTVKKCLFALKIGDTSFVNSYAEKIISWRGFSSEDEARGGAECLKAVTGEEYVYDFVKNKFVTGAEIEGAVTLRQKKLLVKEVRQNRALLMKLVKELESRLNLASKTLEEVRKSREFLNNFTIETDIYEACTKEYSRYPLKTILNPVCVKSFKKNVHPKLEKSINDKYTETFEQYNELLERQTTMLEKLK
tara:strand:- start:157 stop:804 length:648 start_codon:yes stop_codon:yes gene_type:complete